MNMIKCIQMDIQVSSSLLHERRGVLFMILMRLKLVLGLLHTLGSFGRGESGEGRGEVRGI